MGGWGGRTTFCGWGEGGAPPPQPHHPRHWPASVSTPVIVGKWGIMTRPEQYTGKAATGAA